MSFIRKIPVLVLLLLIIVGNESWKKSLPANSRMNGFALRRISIAAVGDTVVHMPIVNASYDEKDNSYDFRPIFTELKANIVNTDFRVGVLETQITPNEQLSGYPRFNSPGAIADALKWAGLDLVFVAHNHSYDKGIDGLKSTLAYLDKIQLPYTGCRRDPHQRNYYLVDLKGIRLAFFSYTTTINGNIIPQEYAWTVNYLDLKKMASDIAAAKKDGADGIILALHTGVEYQREPTAEQQVLVDKLFSLGADIIIGSHVHVIEPFQFVTIKDPLSQTSRIGFVAYSIGNLLSNQRWRYSDCGLLLKFVLEKIPGRPGISIVSVSHTPLWVNRYIRQGRAQYRVKVINKVENIMTDSDPDLNDAARKRMQEVWIETEEFQNSWIQRSNMVNFSNPPVKLFTGLKN